MFETQWNWYGTTIMYCRFCGAEVVISTSDGESKVEGMCEHGTTGFIDPKDDGKPKRMVVIEHQ